MLDEKKSICCHDCGHMHPMDTSCPKPFLTGKRSCARRSLKETDEEIKCKECGWHWNIADGGKDPYTCHKCGCDNTPVRRELHTMDHDGHDEHHQLRVDVEEAMDYCPQCLAEYIEEHWNTLEEAEYKGRKVSLGKPFLTPGGPKKRSVYVKNAKGNVVKVNFGDPNLKIKKNIPARRKAFRARHKCATAKDRTSPRYWSCKHW